jgi:hypothetical protein
MNPHPHAALIHLWADGAEIQAKHAGGDWITTIYPTWHPDVNYRLKPKESVKRMLYWMHNTGCHWTNTNAIGLFDPDTNALLSVEIERP